MSGKGKFVPKWDKLGTNESVCVYYRAVMKNKKNTVKM